MDKTSLLSVRRKQHFTKGLRWKRDKPSLIQTSSYTPNFPNKNTPHEKTRQDHSNIHCDFLTGNICHGAKQSCCMFILSQADGDLVSAVDFSPHYLVTGHEVTDYNSWYIKSWSKDLSSLNISSQLLLLFFQDSYVGVWKLPEGTRTHTLTGHNGGVTGISLQGSLAATSSYDSMVRKMLQKSEF